MKIDQPSPNQVLDELVSARATNRSLQQFESIVSGHQYLRAYDMVLRHVPDGAAVLDWGSGNGHFSYFLLRSGYQTSGYGFGNVSQLCKPFVPDQYDYTDGDNEPVKLPYADEQFDAVTSIGVLEHVRETGGNEVGSMAEINRVLKPGGVFICFHLPNQYSWIEAGQRATKRFASNRRYAHPFRYTAHQIEQFAEQTGFNMVEIKRYGALPRNIWGWATTKNQRVRQSKSIAKGYDRLDNLLGVPLSPFCQCYKFVARKK